MTAPSKAPQPKVVAGGMVGTVATVLIWALREFWGYELDGEVAAALVVLAMTAASYLKDNSYWLRRPSCSHGS